MSHPFQYFDFQDGVLSADRVSLKEIAKEVGTPVYVYSAEAFLTPLRKLQKGLQGLDYLICFAVKSNSNTAILKLLAEAGAGMDVVSGGELYRAVSAKVPAKKIVFSGVGKSREEIRTALELDGDGIFSFNVESVAELKTMSDLALSMNRKANVAFRFNPDVDAKTHPYISTGIKKNKFGMNRAEILQIVRQMDQYPGIELRGMSIHIGSQLLTLTHLKDAFMRLRSLVEEINSCLDKPLSFVDLGGGLGITYKSERTPPIEKYCLLVQKVFGKGFKSKGKSKSKGKGSKALTPLKIVIEPGRIISGNAGVLLTEVLYRKERKSKDFVIVDAAMTELIRPALYESYHEIVPVDQKHTGNSKGRLNASQSLKASQSHKTARFSKKMQNTEIVGPVCESSDCFGKDRLLSKDLQPGDYLAILSAGAYGFTMASNYNSRPRPPEILIHNGQYRTIRRRETNQDLIQAEQEFL